MFSKILKSVAALAVPLFVAFFGYQLNKSEPDVRYTLSDKIPYTVNNKPSETVQQMEVRNIGNAPAKKVVLRLPGAINIVSMDKYSQADNVQIFQKNGFELDYPELPPQGRFKIVFTNANGVDDNSVSISHSGGQGTAALSSDKNSNSWANVFFRLGFPLAFGIYMLMGLRKSSAEFHKYSSQLSTIETALVAKKPWYMTNNEWSKMLNAAIYEMATSGYFARYELQNSNAYKILGVEKPEPISDTNWKDIQQKSIDVLQKNYADALINSYPKDEALKLLRLEKPIYFPLHLWEELEMKTCTQAVRAKNEEPIRYKEAYEMLQTEKPKELPDAYWQQITGYMREKYFRLLKSEMLTQESPLEFLHDQDLTILKREEVASLKQDAVVIERYKKFPTTCNIETIDPIIVRGKPEWLTEQQYGMLKRVSQRLKEVDANSTKCNSIMEKIKLILEKESIGDERPQEIDENIWEKLTSIEQLVSEIRSLEERANQVKVKEIELTEAETKNRIIREKIEKQLNIVHEALIDPSFIDRIEDYSNVFAPRNFENLKRVASLNQSSIFQ